MSIDRSVFENYEHHESLLKVQTRVYSYTDCEWTEDVIGVGIGLGHCDRVVIPVNVHRTYIRDDAGPSTPGFDDT
jgi:hypothetical protein